MGPASARRIDVADQLAESLMAADPHAGGLATGAFRIEPRLLLSGNEREDLNAYRGGGGYAPGLAGADLVEAVKDAGLLGRGGAAFPTGVKLQTLADQPGPKYIVANGEEGEPAAIKDRWLLRKRPHLVLDGLLRAAEAIGAQEAYVYVSDAQAEASVLRAVEELGRTVIPLNVFKVEPGYVAGEETSVVRAIDGGPAKPTDKPPRPFQSGIDAKPTMVSNVETFANIPMIATRGAAAFRNGGFGEASHGTLLLTVSGAVERPGLYEVPHGAPLGVVLQEMAGLQDGFRGVLMGGFFAGLANARILDCAVSYQELKEEGSGLGCGAIIVLGTEDCPVAAAGDVMAYFARENAGQCGACFRGTPAMSKAIEAIGLGSADDGLIEKLKGWSVSLRGRGACATLDGAAQLAASLFNEFPEEIAAHRPGDCPHCRRLLPAGERTRFAVG
jgi:NADH:ubiquinone oxidoreductase subunit F (NADH-binding)